MTRSVRVTKGAKKDTYKVLVDQIQRGKDYTSVAGANSEATKAAQQENIQLVVLMKE